MLTLVLLFPWRGEHGWVGFFLGSGDLGEREAHVLLLVEEGGSFAAIGVGRGSAFVVRLRFDFLLALED